MDGTPVGNLLAAAMLLYFLICGYAIVRAVRLDAPFYVQLWLGVALGILLLMWMPALFAFALGFTVAAHLCGMGLCLLIAAGLCLWRRPRLLPSRREAARGLSLPFLACVLPMAALAVYLLWHHTLRPVEGALHTGQSCYGDMSMHLGFVTSIARQGFFPPEYSVLPGVKLGYPFLCDSVSSSLYLTGSSLRFAYILPAAVAMASVFAGFFILMEAWVGRRGAVIAFWLFFAGGGFGFAYFFNGSASDPGNFLRIFTEFYQTPTNLTGENIRWVNPIADLMLPQRATLFGWTLLLPCLYLLLRLHRGEKLGLPATALLGAMAGGMPMVHTHSFLALGLLSAAVFVRALLADRPHIRRTLLAYLPYAAIAAALALPQLLTWTFRQAAGDSFLRLHFNWANNGDPYLWFYIKNIGVVFLLLIPALVTSKERRSLWLCALPIWLLAEVVVFQPNEYDNNKLLYVVHMLSCGAVGGWLADLSRKEALGRLRYAFVAAALFVGMLSGALTIVREVVSDYEVFGAQHVKAARYLDEALPADAVVLTAGNHNNAVAALTGRNIVYGADTYLYFHGVSDPRRYADREHMLASPATRDTLFREYGVTYIYFSDFEYAKGASRESFEGYPVLYDADGITVLQVGE